MKRTREEIRAHSFLFERKKILLLGIIFFLAIINIGCTSNSNAKSKAEIEKDLLENLNKKFSLNSFEITKRQTNEKDKTDTVWITCEVSSDFIVSTIESVLYYELFNDGWQIVDSDLQRDSATPIASSITQSDVEEKLYKEGYENVEFVSRDENPEIQERDIFHYTYQEEIGLIKRTYDLQIRYVFQESGLDSYWGFDKITETKTEETIDGIVGTWKYKGDNGSDNYKNAGKVKDIYVNIVSIDLMNMQIEMEYDFKDYAYDTMSAEFYSASSNGVETFKLQVYNPSKDTISIQIDNVKFRGGLYIEPVDVTNWVGAGKGQGILFSGGSAVWLEKE